MALLSVAQKRNLKQKYQPRYNSRSVPIIPGTQKSRRVVRGVKNQQGSLVQRPLLTGQVPRGIGGTTPATRRTTPPRRFRGKSLTPQFPMVPGRMTRGTERPRARGYSTSKHTTIGSRSMVPAGPRIDRRVSPDAIITPRKGPTSTSVATRGTVRAKSRIVQPPVTERGMTVKGSRVKTHTSVPMGRAKPKVRPPMYPPAGSQGTAAATIPKKTPFYPPVVSKGTAAVPYKRPPSIPKIGPHSKFPSRGRGLIGLGILATGLAGAAYTWLTSKGTPTKKAPGIKGPGQTPQPPTPPAPPTPGQPKTPPAPKAPVQTPGRSGTRGMRGGSTSVAQKKAAPAAAAPTVWQQAMPYAIGAIGGLAVSQLLSKKRRRGPQTATYNYYYR